MNLTSKSYSSLVLLLFMRNINRKAELNMKQLIHIIDKLGEKLNVTVDISEATKYNTIKDLVKSGVLQGRTEHGCYLVSLSDVMKEYIDSNMTITIKESK